LDDENKVFKTFNYIIQHLNTWNLNCQWVCILINHFFTYEWMGTLWIISKKWWSFEYFRQQDNTELTTFAAGFFQINQTIVQSPSKNFYILVDWEESLLYRIIIDWCVDAR
jgi:hypothetical protein